MIRVLLADDEAVVRAGLRTILTSDPELEIVAEAGDGREAVELAERHRPDVALLDIRMPGMDGLAATEAIHRGTPEVGVLVVTTFGEDAYIVQALQMGANGFILKTADPHGIIDAVRTVAAGGAALSPEVALRLVAALRSGPMPRWFEAQERVVSLAPREREVLGLLGTGLSNADIGHRLHMAEGTVKGYVSAIFDRLGVENRVQAALISYQAGLTPRP